MPVMRNSRELQNLAVLTANSIEWRSARHTLIARFVPLAIAGDGLTLATLYRFGGVNGLSQHQSL